MKLVSVYALNTTLPFAIVFCSNLSKTEDSLILFNDEGIITIANYGYFHVYETTSDDDIVNIRNLIIKLTKIVQKS